jgi:hypothetical protein
VDYPTGSSPVALAYADFNGDGKIDLAVVNQNANTVSILLGNGNGTFQTHVDYPVGNYPVGIVAAPFTDNGTVDLAVANWNDGTVSILLGVDIMWRMEDVRERVEALRREISQIQKLNLEHLQTPRPDYTSIEAHTRREQRLKDIRRELKSMTAWKRT